MADELTPALNAEYTVLGAILIDETVVRDVLATVDPADFTSQGLRAIFQAARDLFRTGEPVDPITIRAKLGDEYTQTLVELMQATPTSANWREHAAIMHDAAVLARLRESAGAVVSATQLDDCREPVAAMSDALASGKRRRGWNMRDLLGEFMDTQELGPDRLDYITCGLSEVDFGTYARPGQVQIIAGRPSDGKTALALQFAFHMAKTRSVGFFSLETDHASVGERLVAMGMGIDSTRIYRRVLEDADWRAVTHMQADYVERRLTVIEAGGMSAGEIQRVAMAYGFEIIFIDYLQLIEPEDLRANRTEQVAQISRSLHTFAQRQNVLVVELSQLSRQEKGTWREPTLQDLRESGQLEQDADLVFFLYRPKPGGKDDPQKTRVLRISKNKRGRLGAWPLYFDGERQQFSHMAGDNGRAIMHKYIADGKAARMKNHIEGQMGFQEIPDDPDNPFTGGDGYADRRQA